MGERGGFEATMGERRYEATMGESEKRSPFTFWFTDYENVEIGYSCDEIMWGWFKNERLSIAGRTPDIDDQVMDFAKALIKERLPGYYEYMFGNNADYENYTTVQGPQCR